MNRRSLTLLSGLALALVGCGPLPLVSGTFEVAQVCKTLPDQTFQGAPLSLRATASSAFQLDLGSVLDPLKEEGVALQVELTSLTLEPKEGVADFGFLEALKLSTPAPTGDEDTLAAYARDRSAPPPVRLELQVQRTVNLADTAQDGQVPVDLTATGEMPTSDWSLAAVACFQVTGSVER